MSVLETPWAGHMRPTVWPVPEGILPFQRGVLKNSGVEISCYQFGSTLVAIAAGNLVRLEFLSVKLDGDELHTNLLGFGATEAHELHYSWCSLYLDPELYLGHSPSDLIFEFLAIVDDGEDDGE